LETATVAAQIPESSFAAKASGTNGGGVVGATLGPRASAVTVGSTATTELSNAVIMAPMVPLLPQGGEVDTKVTCDGEGTSAVPPLERPALSPVLKSAIRKLRNAGLGAAAELKSFRRFMKAIYSTPGEAFDDFTAFSQNIERADFKNRLEELGYPGNADRVFSSLCDEDGCIDRDTFKKRMVAVGQGRQPGEKKRSIQWGEVEEHAILAHKTNSSRPPSRQDHSKADAGDKCVNGLSSGNEDQEPSSNDKRTAVSTIGPSPSAASASGNEHHSEGGEKTQSGGWHANRGRAKGRARKPRPPQQGLSSDPCNANTNLDNNV